MKKSFYYIVLTFITFATVACHNGDYPAKIQGKWSYNDTINTIQSVLSTSSSSASKGIPATIDYVTNDTELSTKVLIDYDPADGQGTFKPEKGIEGLQGSFEAIDQQNIKLTLFNIDKKGERTTLLKNAVYTLI